MAQVMTRSMPPMVSINRIANSIALAMWRTFLSKNAFA
jgi:hypothetical protein